MVDVIANYDSIDSDWTWDGDFIRGNDGDFKDTSDDYIKSLRNELHSLLRSEFDDWELHPNFATNISEYRGEPNNRPIADAMRDRIKSRIVAAGLVYMEDLDVRIVPVGQSQVLTIIRINATATPANGLIVGEPLTVHFLYDSLEDSVFFLPPSKYEEEYIGR